MFPEVSPRVAHYVMGSLLLAFGILGKTMGGGMRGKGTQRPMPSSIRLILVCFGIIFIVGEHYGSLK
ncbi:MAG: hypothetical protein ABI672_08515 [Vicinamibacteria bacterium]